ncbi:von Willebrand factor type A domain protein [Nonomuraea coxensis DSM 45129]|uniref:von Willebrand factor type A domain protein n=1 Tax=Nonomuraea coxensis DSM 45129 TaxID=1122611 RepID=A0ABX8TX57_9ACTN|nr:VWA domain-containing protein [Nonomuraea coxensis]QYC39866.1 von Willebrand factor type A domain protein [Nonomuraea coxensis DSM 45129]
MSDQPTFTLTIDQNKYLPLDGREVHAILSVGATGGITTQVACPAEAAEVIIVDTSGSMSGGKIREARQAAVTAVQTLRDGAYFAVIAGTERATMVYPRGNPHLVKATPATRAEAHRVIDKLLAHGGTAIGEWLKLAGHLLTAHPSAIRHALLMTDGQNNERPDVFASVLAAWSGKFVVDCLGVGADWVPAELRKVAEAMLGTFDFVRDQGDLPEYFRRLTQTSMSKTVAELSLRVWVPQTARLKFVKQVSPVLLDLTGKRTDVNPLTGDYPTGSWGAEEREYHVCVEVPPGQIGQEIRAGWVKLVRPDTGDVLASGNVLAQWTDDLAQSTRINGKVAHYTGQAELHDLIQDGLSARAAGDVDTATARLAKAREIAVESGREDTARLLERVVEVDPASGTARLRRNVDKADEIELDTGSVRTSRLRKEGL